MLHKWNNEKMGWVSVGEKFEEKRAFVVIYHILQKYRIFWLHVCRGHYAPAVSLT